MEWHSPGFSLQEDGRERWIWELVILYLTERVENGLIKCVESGEIGLQLADGRCRADPEGSGP